MLSEFRTRKLERVHQWDFLEYRVGMDVHSYQWQLDEIPNMEPPPSMQHIQVEMEQFADRLRAPLDAFEQAVANESPAEITESLEQQWAVLDTTDQVFHLLRNFCPDDVERTEPCPTNLESKYIGIVHSHMNRLRGLGGPIRGRAQHALVLEWDFSEYRVESDVQSYRQEIDVLAGLQSPPSMQHIQDDFVQFADHSECLLTPSSRPWSMSPHRRSPKHCTRSWPFCHG